MLTNEYDENRWSRFNCVLMSSCAYRITFVNSNVFGLHKLTCSIVFASLFSQSNFSLETLFGLLSPPHGHGPIILINFTSTADSVYLLKITMILALTLPKSFLDNACPLHSDFLCHFHPSVRFNFQFILSLVNFHGKRCGSVYSPQLLITIKVIFHL